MARNVKKRGRDLKKEQSYKKGGEQRHGVIYNSSTALINHWPGTFSAYSILFSIQDCGVVTDSRHLNDCVERPLASSFKHSQWGQLNSVSGGRQQNTCLSRWRSSKWNKSQLHESEGVNLRGEDHFTTNVNNKIKNWIKEEEALAALKREGLKNGDMSTLSSHSTTNTE